MAASPLLFPDFEARILSLYRPPLRAPKTYSKMRLVLREFGAVPSVRTAADLDTVHVAVWLARRAEAGGNPNTTLSLARSLRAASLIALAEGWIERPPLWKRLMPRAGPRLRVRHFDRGQVVALLDHLEACARGGDWQARRLLALVAVVAYTGLRKTEALTLQLPDVDLTTGLLHVVARRRLKTPESAAPVPIAPELALLLAAWLPSAGPLWVFPGVTRVGPWSGGPMGYRAIDALQAAGRAVGMPGLTFHSLRHTLAKLGLGEFGLSIDQVRTLLRHTTPVTTELYTHRDDAALLRRIGDRIQFHRPSAGPPPSI